MFNRITRGLGRALVLGAALATTAVLSATPAEASIGVVTGARLAIAQLPDGRCQVSVDGRVPMTQTEAQGLMDSGHRFLVRVWGEDPISDDLLLETYVSRINPAAIQSSYFVATADGLRFRVRRIVNPSQLNEDDGPDFGDELYAGIRLINSDGTTIRSGESNRLGGYDIGFVGCQR